MIGTEGRIQAPVAVVPDQAEVHVVVVGDLVPLACTGLDVAGIADDQNLAVP